MIIILNPFETAALRGIFSNDKNFYYLQLVNKFDGLKFYRFYTKDKKKLRKQIIAIFFFIDKKNQNKKRANELPKFG